MIKRREAVMIEDGVLRYIQHGRHANTVDSMSQTPASYRDYLKGGGGIPPICVV